MSDRISTASCFCGAIIAEMRGEPFWVCFDHDDDCRKAIGGPMALWVGFRPHQVTFTKGAPRSFSKTPGVVRTFCETCGTSISYTDTGIESEEYFTIGFFDDPDAFEPMAHAYFRKKLPFLKVDDQLDKVDEYSRERDKALGNPRDR